MPDVTTKYHTPYGDVTVTEYELPDETGHAKDKLSTDGTVDSWAVDQDVPIGGIIEWSGAINTIPSNFALCNGIANAPGPDLTALFVAW